MPFERVQHRRDQWLQPLAADSIGSLPQDQERLPNCFVVELRDTHAPIAYRGAPTIKFADRVFPMPPCYRDELIENPALLGTTSSPIPISNRFNQLPP